jgi:hypothetical protein
MIPCGGFRQTTADASQKLIVTDLQGSVQEKLQPKS